jgi:NAD dependent epimerase/dehydratase
LSTYAVTGAGGFIGSHLVERLLRDGHEVRALVRYTSTSSVGFLGPAEREWPGQLAIEAGALEDPGSVNRLIAGADAVLHLGALIGIPYSYVAPHHYVQTNIVGTINVLDAVRSHGVQRMVHVSTSETYGTAQFVPISESHPVHAQSPYAATKAGADQLALSYQRSFGTPVVVVRPFNTYGPRQSARAFIPTVITQALTGDVVKLGSLAPRRDLTFVADTVDGMVRASTAPNVEGLEINLGTGISYSVGEVAERIVALVNPAATIVHDPDRDRPADSEVMELQSDISLARRLLDYDPTTPLDAGLEATIAYMRENLAAYRVGEYLV